MPAASEGEGVERFRPVITRPSQWAPKLTPNQTSMPPFRAYDLANTEQNNDTPQPSSKDGQDIGTLPVSADIAPSLLTFVATAVVRQQLCYHSYTSKVCSLSHEHCPNCSSMDNAIRQTVLDEAMKDGAHVPAANNIESLKIPEDMSGPAANESEMALDSDLDNGITLNKQRDQKPEERKTVTSPNKRLASMELPLVGGKRARVTEPDRSLNPSTSTDVPDSPRKRAQKPYVSTKVDDVQNRPGVRRSRIPVRRRRVIESDTDDDTDEDEDKMRITDDEEEKFMIKKDEEEENLQMLSDDEEELQALAENQNGATRRKSRRIMERDARRQFWHAYVQQENEDDGWDYEHSSDVECVGAATFPQAQPFTDPKLEEV